MTIIKRLSPYIFIFIVWFIFSYQFFLKGLVPFPSTYQVNFFAPWSSYEKYWGPVKNNAMPDIITQIYPWKYFTIDQWKKGQIPLWNPYSFSGTPHLANYQSAVLSPFNLLFFIFSFVNAWSLLILLQPFLAGIFMYIFIRSLKISIHAGLISSVSFMFCGFITTWMDYGTLGYAILFLPLALFSIEKFYDTNNFRFLFLFSFTIPLSFFSGHLQTSLYFLTFVTIYLLYKFLTIKQKNKFVFSILYLFFGMLLTLPQILPSIEFYSLSLRSSIFQKMEVIPWAYLPTLFAPDFYGNPVTRNDWFGHYAEWNSYIGLIPLLLGFYAIINIIIKKSRKIIFFFITATISILLAFNTPLVDLLISLHIPVLSTSAASRIIVIFSFSMSVLAAFGFDFLMFDLNHKIKKPVIYWLTFCFIIFSFLWGIVLFGLIPDPSKTPIAKNNLILPSFIFMMGFVIISCAFFRKKFILLMAYFLLIAASYDLLRFALKWQPFDPKNLVFPDTPVTKFYPEISSYFRVLGNFEAGNGVYYKLPSVEGYDPLNIARYGEFINAINNGKISDPSRSVVSFSRHGLFMDKAVELLGVKYIIHKVSDNKTSWTFPFWQYPIDQFAQIYKDDKFEIYENKKILSRVFLANNYNVISNRQEIINTLFDKKFDYQNNIIVEENPRFPQGKSKVKQINIVTYLPNEINIKAVSDSKSLLLLTDIFYPGWKVFVDNKETPILRADYTFRSVIVPEGSHNVKFIYDPESFRLGIYLSGVGLLGIILIGVVTKKTKTKYQRSNDK